MMDNIAYFLDMMAAEKGSSTNTIAAYGRDLEQFLVFVGKKDCEVDNGDIEKFVQHLGAALFSPKTIARKLSAIREFYKFLYMEKLVKDNPALDILSPKQEKPLPKFLTENEISSLITTAKNDLSFSGRRLSAMLKLMYACGLRVSELVGLPDGCINFKENQIMIFGKGSKERIVPVARGAIEEIEEYKEFRDKHLNGQKSPWLFPSLHAKSGHITRDAFFKNIKNLAIKAGISPQKISPHVLRHSFATHLLDHKVDLRSVQKMLGHEDISTTEIYTHVVSQKLRDEVEKNHPLAKRACKM
ncbi:MAG: tyrosine recombinase XerD [Alphaproteobacteria bacterium]|nr:tyrosine recombinase XerD [Alphaproteobacteria bacterium]